MKTGKEIVEAWRHSASSKEFCEEADARLAAAIDAELAALAMTEIQSGYIGGPCFWRSIDGGVEHEFQDGTRIFIDANARPRMTRVGGGREVDYNAGQLAGLRKAAEIMQALNDDLRWAGHYHNAWDKARYEILAVAQELEARHE